MAAERVTRRPRRPPQAKKADRVSLSGVLLQHFPLLATVLAFVFVVVKIYRVSGLDTATALTLISRAGVATVILGALLGVLPQISASALTWIAFAFYHSKDAETRTLLASVATIILVPGSLLLPWPSAAVLWVIVLLLVVAILLRQRRGKEAGSVDLAGIIIVGISTVLITPTMWLPSEVVRIQNESPAIGYVITADNQWTIIMREDDRKIAVVPSRDVLARTVCNLTNGPSRSISQMVYGESAGNRNPSCESLVSLVSR